MNHSCASLNYSLCCLTLLPKALLCHQPGCPLIWAVQLGISGCMEGTTPLMALGTEGLKKCHWEGERPPPLAGNQQGFHWTRSFKLMVWKPNLAIFYLWSTENYEFVTKFFKKGEKSNTKKPSYMASLKTRKPHTTVPVSPQWQSAELCQDSFRHPQHSTPRAVLVILPTLLMSLKISILIGTKCQWSQYFRIQTLFLKPILLPQAAKQLFVRLCFLIHSLEILSP